MFAPLPHATPHDDKQRGVPPQLGTCGVVGLVGAVGMLVCIELYLPTMLVREKGLIRYTYQAPKMFLYFGRVLIQRIVDEVEENVENEVSIPGSALAAPLWVGIFSIF